MQKLENKKLEIRVKVTCLLELGTFWKTIFFFLLIYCWLNNCGTWGQELYSIWEFPRPRIISSLSAALVGEFLTDEPPRKPWK